MIRFLILFFYYYVPLFLYIVIIYLFSSFSFTSVSFPFVDYDKYIHILEYSVLGFLFIRAYLNTTGESFKVRGVFTTIFFTFLVGCSDEYNQLFVPDRVVSIGDLAADTAGGLLGSIFYLIVLYVRRWKGKKDEQNSSI